MRALYAELDQIYCKATAPTVASDPMRSHRCERTNLYVGLRRDTHLNLAPYLSNASLRAVIMKYFQPRRLRHLTASILDSSYPDVVTTVVDFDCGRYVNLLPFLHGLRFSTHDPPVSRCISLFLSAKHYSGRDECPV